MKRQPKGWEKIFANHICDKGLIPKIYEEITQQQNLKVQVKTEQRL